MDWINILGIVMIISGIVIGFHLTNFVLRSNERRKNQFRLRRQERVRLLRSAKRKLDQYEPQPWDIETPQESLTIQEDNTLHLHYWMNKKKKS